MRMSVEQALKDAEWLANAAYAAGVHELGYDPIAVLRSHIEREVDEAMVERAARAYNMFFFTSPATHDQAMKAALVAALGDSHDRTR